MLKTSETTKLIHDNLWVVISFAFGQPAVGKFVDKHFQGEWKYLNKTIYQRAETRADRALLEMATQLRVLDDAEGLTNTLKQRNPSPLGIVIQCDGTETDLHFRDVTNKIMHAAKFEWALSDPDNPKIICHPHNSDRWQKAEIDIAALMGFVGMLMH